MNARAQQKLVAQVEKKAPPKAAERTNRFRHQESPGTPKKSAKIIPLPTVPIVAPVPAKSKLGPPAEAPTKSKKPATPHSPLEDFAASTPTEKIRRFPALGPAVGHAVEAKKSATASQAASVRIELPGSPADTSKGVPAAAPQPAKAALNVPRDGEVPVNASPAKAAGPLNRQAPLSEAQLGAAAVDADQRERQVDAAVAAIDTTAPIDTSTGPPPDLPLTGASDPERSARLGKTGNSLIEAETGDQRSWAATAVDRAQAPPAAAADEAPVRLETPPVEMPAAQIPADALAYAGAELPDPVRSAADQRLATQMAGAVSGARSEALAAEVTRESKLMTAQDAHSRALEEATTQTEKERQEAHASAGADLNTASGRVDDTLVKAEKKHRGEVATETARVATTVQDRAGDDKQSAQTRLDQAEAEARSQKSTAEKEARQEKQKLADQQGEASWWDRAVDWIRSAVNALVATINTLFSKLRKAVRRIITQARDAAVKLLEAGRQWIVAKLDHYQSWLQDKLNTYLDGFPAIQGLLMKAIDLYFTTLKAAVNLVVEGLKAAVTHLANLYAAVLDKILSVYQTVLTTVVRAYGAILSGDFKEAFRIVLISACEIVGVDPKPVLALVDRAGELARRALMHLIKFWFNVGSAIGKGIQQFADHIKKHLMGGLIGWLTGALGDTEIEVPERFDFKGVLRLVMSVMGLTYNRIRKKVVKRLGPGGETAVGRMEKAAGLMQRLFKDGPLALWEDLKKTVSDLPKLLITALSTWLTERLVGVAIIKIVSLLTPVTAIVGAVKSLYDIVIFLIERSRQIVEFVQSVYAAVKEMVLGNVQKAADAIESAMARSLPVIISFMASLIGLGGIGKAVRGVITKLRKPIDKVVNKVIKRLVKMGRRFVAKGKAAAKKLGRWWQARRSFKTKKGEAHELRFKGEGKRARLMVRSTPEPYKKFLHRVNLKLKNKNFPNAAALQQSYSAAVKQHKALDSEVASRKRKDSHTTDPKLKTLELLLKDTKELMDKLEESEQTDLPKSHIKYGGTTSQPAGFGKSMTAAPLTMKGKPGSEPKVPDTPAWSDLNLRRDGGGSYYVKGHLLNDNIHGPGNTWENLVPLSRSGNKQHELRVEAHVKQAVIHEHNKPHRGIVYYRVLPKEYYPQRSNSDSLVTAIRTSSDSDEVKTAKEKVVKAEAHVPKELVCESFAYDMVKRAPNKKIMVIGKSTVPVSNKIDQSSPAVYQVGDIPAVPRELKSLNLRAPYPDKTPSGAKEERARTILSMIPGIGPVRAQALWKANDALRRIPVNDNTRWETFTDQNSGPGLSSEIVAKLKAYESNPRKLLEGKTVVSPPYPDG